MRETIVLFLKGIVIGIGKVIPGVSGSVLAILLGVYEKGVYALSHYFENPKEHTFFLLKTGLGILCSLTFGSKLILYLLQHHYLPIMLLFLGMILGTMPAIKKKTTLLNVNLFTRFCIAFFIGLLLTNLSFGEGAKDGNISFFFLLITGFVEAATMIIPGISGTAILMIMGSYSLLLTTFSHLLNIQYLLYNIQTLIPFVIGLLLGTIIVTKTIYYYLKKDEQKTYSMILGFSLSSFLLLVKNTIGKASQPFHPTFLFLFLLGLFISYSFSTKE